MEGLRPIARFDLRPGLTPLELCLQPGTASSELLVFVNSYDLQNECASCLLALSIDLSSDDPQFCEIAELAVGNYCSGMCIQGQNLIAGYSPDPEKDWSEAVVWDWRRDEKIVVRSPPPARRYWFMTASQRIVSLWNSQARSIEVLRRSPSGEYEHIGDHRPTSFPIRSKDEDITEDTQAMVPTLIDPWNAAVDPRLVALAYLEQETLRIDIEDPESGRVSFTSYPTDNTYMQDPRDMFSPYGDVFEVPDEFVKTVSGHLVDLSSSSRLTIYLAPEDDEDDGREHVSYRTASGEDIRLDQYYSAIPFICPFSGIVGKLRSNGELYLWKAVE
ncbi:hypothetical protein FRB90_007072 [Tulasnella sp. 427]|nr:hypothetical protein FRB90_007072 [Tulasnella sp. 427]